jgi:hypothetical protein
MVRTECPDGLIGGSAAAPPAPARVIGPARGGALSASGPQDSVRTLVRTWIHSPIL